MTLAPRYKAIRRETSGKPLTREKPAKFLGTGHQCKDGYCHQLSIIFESVETFSVVHANVGQNVTPHNPSLGLFLYHFLHTIVT
jgi:hypothetical protein